MSSRRIRMPDFAKKKSRGEKIVMLTAYDATMARLLDRADVDALLVGDSVGTAVLGHETTLPVTLDAMLHHTAAVARGTEHALVVADMPFLTYQVSVAEAVRNAGRLVQEGGAAAVKLEGGRPMFETVKRLVDIGIPVMGHLGLQPQSVHQVGGFVRRATRPAEVDTLLEDAALLEDAGAFAVVLEAIPADVARNVTRHMTIPTIGIGSGPDCDGQILVSYDMLGLLGEQAPAFVKQYARLAETVTQAAESYAADVRTGRYPAATEPAVPARTTDPRG